MSSDEKDKTRNATGVKFSSFTPVQAVEGNPIEVVGLRDGDNVRATLTTDLVETNPNAFRDSKGRFVPAPEELSELTNQRSVNEFLWKYTQEGSDGHEELKESHDKLQDSHGNLQEIVENGLTLQASIEEEVDVLNSKVASLEGAVGEHSLIFTSSQQNPRAGQFNLKDAAYQLVNSISDAKYITLNEVDRNDNPINLDRVVIGDVLRLSDISSQTAELKVTGIADASVFTFESLGGGLDRLSELPYDFFLLSSFDPAGLASIDYVDSRDNTKLNLSGGKITGDLEVEGDLVSFHGKADVTGGHNFFSIRSDGEDGHQVVSITQGGAIKLNAGFSTPYMAKNADEAMTRQAAERLSPLMHPMWRYMGTDSNLSGNDLKKGEFLLKWEGSGEGRKVYLYIHRQDANGQYWHAKFGDKGYQHGMEMMGSVTEASGNIRFGTKIVKLWFNEGTNNYARVDGHYAKEERELTRWAYYTINVPGLLPAPVYSNHYNNSSTFDLVDEDPVEAAPVPEEGSDEL